MKPKREKISEAELCRRFIAYAEPQGWKAYAETGGYDIVLAKNDVQIGVHAKLHFNATLLRQLLPNKYDRFGPNYIAALLPKCDSDASQVLEYLGVMVFTPHRDMQWDERIAYYSGLDNGIEYRPQWEFDEPIQLPNYIPDVPAGMSSPVQLTPWKIGALRMWALLSHQGFVTKSDLDRMHVDPRFFRSNELISYDRASKKYTKGQKELRAATQHPNVYQQILDEIRTGSN